MQVISYMCTLGNGMVFNDSHLSERSREFLFHIIDTGLQHSKTASPSESYRLFDLTAEDFD